MRARERVMLGLRLDAGVRWDDAQTAIDPVALERLAAGGLVRRRPANGVPETLVLTERGRRLGGAVTAELLAEPSSIA